MKAVLALVFVGFIVALFVWLPSSDEPRQSDIDGMHRQAAITDARIALIDSKEGCVSMADGKYSKAVTESMNYVGLKPDFQRIFQEGDESSPDAPSDEQRGDLRAQFDSLGHAGLVLLMCLRHLDDRGIAPLEDSVPTVANRIFENGPATE